MHEPEGVCTALAVTDSLTSLAIPYYLVGSFATTIYGFPRECQDIDLVADLKPDRADALIAALQAQFHIATQAVQEAVSSHTFFPVHSWDVPFHVDIFVAQDSAWAHSEMARRRLVAIESEPGRTVFVASPEDMLLERFLRYQTSGEVSDQHWQDVLGILTLQSSHLDFGYISAIADSLGIFADWQRVWRIMDQDSYQEYSQC